MRASGRLVATLVALTAATPLAAGPPWISIELPANRIDPETRGAFLVVRTYHHATPVQLVMRGTAEGLVNGARRSVALSYRSTSQTGVFALDRNWGDGGPWVLDIRAFDGHMEMSAVVGVGTTGEVGFVRVPLSLQGFPRTVSRSEVETMLQALARGQTPPPLSAAGFGLPSRDAAIPAAIFAAVLIGCVKLLALGVRRLRAAF